METTHKKTFDLETRTENFAKRCRKFVRALKLDICNREDGKQLARSSGSVGANYIEANESLSKKDFIFRVKVCRKEVKESRYWLSLINLDESPLLIDERISLVNEANELMKIFGSIIIKSSKEPL